MGTQCSGQSTLEQLLELCLTNFACPLRRYQPKGSWHQGDRRRSWIPFSMWTPPGAHRREAKRRAVQSEWKTFKGT